MTGTFGVVSTTSPATAACGATALTVVLSFAVLLCPRLHAMSVPSATPVQTMRSVGPKSEWFTRAYRSLRYIHPPCVVGDIDGRCKGKRMSRLSEDFVCALTLCP